MQHKKINGYTFLELLVVIIVIMVLAMILLTTITSSLKRGRDTERKSNINQYKIALENYANEHNGLYPASASPINITSICSTDDNAKALYKYASRCISDKKAGFTYSYASDTLKWTLLSPLELGNKYWVVCSNGKAGEVTSSPNINSGNCPI